MTLTKKQLKKRLQNEKSTMIKTNDTIIETIQDNKIIIEGDKRRVNITINAGLWEKLDKNTYNKSGTVEQLITKFLEKLEGKEIILIKPDF